MVFSNLCEIFRPPSVPGGSRIRCKNFALLVSVSSVWPTSSDELFDGTDKILWPTIRCGGVNGSSISSKTYVKGREFKAASTSTRPVDHLSLTEHFV